MMITNNIRVEALTRMLALFVALLAVGTAVPLAAKDKEASAIPVSGLKIVEQTIEAATSQVILPGGDAGILVVTPCAGCAPVSLTSSAATQWLVGKERVTLVAFRQHLAKTPRAQLGVCYSKGNSELRRVIATQR